MTDYEEGTSGSDEPEAEAEGWREGAPNPTQQRIDREGGDDRPGDVAWEEDRWGDPAGQESGEGETGP